METSCDIRHENDLQLPEVIGDVIREVIEECVDNCSIASEQEVETKVRNGSLHRTIDSDDEMHLKTDSEGKTQTSSVVILEDNQSNDCLNIIVKTDPKETIVSSNSTGDTLDKMADNSKGSQTKEKKKFIKSPKWGESVGIADANGRPKRIVNLSEVKNFIPLRMRFESQFKYYFSIVDFRYPQLFRDYDSGEQRWRMRYNIFVDGLFDTQSKDDSIVHIGEIMLYFDIGRHYFQPFFVNCTFYANYTPLNRNVDATRLTKMIVRLHDILTSNLILQLKFPIDGKLFRNINYLYHKFFCRQNEMLNELDFLQNNNYWIPSSKWPSGDTNHAINPNTVSYGRTQFDCRFKETNRSKVSKKNGEDNTRPTGAHNEHKSQKSGEPTIHSNRRNVSSNTRRSTRRSVEKVNAREGKNEKESPLDQKGANDKSLSKPKKSSQRKSRTFGRKNAMEENNYPEVRPSDAFRKSSFADYGSQTRPKRRYVSK